MSKTIKQIADELGVDKQRVYRFVVKNNITASSEVKQSKLYDDAAETLIRDHFLSSTASGNPHQKHIDDVLIERLLSQLDAKDQQIKELNLRLAECSAALVAAQKAELIAQENAKAAQLLHAGTMQQQLNLGSPAPGTDAGDADQNATPRKWWQFWK